MVLFCEVFEQDHVVLFIGVVDKHRLGAHTKHLANTEESQQSSESQGVQCISLHSDMYTTYLREADQYQQSKEVGAFESLWQLLNTMVSEGSNDCAPLRTSIQTVQNICHRACPIQTNTTAKHRKRRENTISFI